MSLNDYADKELTEPKTQPGRASRIEMAIGARLSPEVLELNDESARHAGHAGARPGGETHFRLRIVAAAFEGLGRVERQRLVHEALREEFVTGLHALTLDLKTPIEASKA